MKKLYLFRCCFAAATILFTCGIAAGYAQSGPSVDGYYLAADTLSADSMRLFELQGVQVTSTRATRTTPVAFSNIDRRQILQSNNGVDLPFLLQMTPSVVVTSDAGTGVGYTGVRIRGTDATRINVTTNGIPVNDAESQSVFWVNMPDIAASLGDIQIQRGVGTSTNGGGAFGGSINLQTEALTPKPYALVSGSYGSFNTHRESVSVGTGLLGGRWAFNARLSNIGSDGYVDRASSRLKSYFLQAGYYGRTTTIKFINFAGKERTYHAWDGVGQWQIDLYGRRYNSCGEIWRPVYDENGYPVLDSDGDLKTELAGYYKDQTDNYTQSNYQLLLTQKLSGRFDLNVNFHYTDGDGYYEQYKSGQTLKKYGLTPFVPGDAAREPYLKNGLVDKSDLIRRKMMDNWFAGTVFSLDYHAPRLEASFGGAANKYHGDHFGNVIWVQNYSGDPDFAPNHRYYDNLGKKTDVNFYLKATWEAARGFYLYGDVQYRHVNYKLSGTNDKWDDNTGAMQSLDVDDKFNFFNPKAGISWLLNDNWSLFASISVGHKDPTRNNYTDAKEGQVPTSERLIDYELGANLRRGIWSAGINLYYMDYKDQLVLTGELNEIGEPLAANMPDSYRAGVELMAGIQILNSLRWDVNATFSRNKIKNYTDYTYRENKLVETYLGTTDIAYSPKVLLGSLISFRHCGFGASLQSNYVGSQWVSNGASRYVYEADNDNERLKLKSYFVNNLRIDYTFKLPSLKSLTLAVNVNNLFNEKYSSNGWGESKFDENYEGLRRVNSTVYFPQAGTNVLASVMLSF